MDILPTKVCKLKKALYGYKESMICQIDKDDDRFEI